MFFGCIIAWILTLVGATFVMRNYIRCMNIGIYIGYKHISTTVDICLHKRVTPFQTLIKTVVQL